MSVICSASLYSFQQSFVKMNMNQDTQIMHLEKLAHPGKRYQGQFIDALISIALFALSIYVFKLLDHEPKYPAIAFFLVPLSYFVLSDSFPNGQSIGKKILGLYCVSKTTGKPCTILQSIARNIFTPVLGVFDAVLILGKRRQRLGDLMANTVVIQKHLGCTHQRDRRGG